jgi:hypothetical protein
MTFIKSFESFKSTHGTRIFVANQQAESLLESFELVEGFYTNADEAIQILGDAGYSSPKDYINADSLNEAFEVKYAGHDTSGKETEIHVDINGHRYGYSAKDGDLDIADVARKFEKMLKFSQGRALNWLKKHTILSSGSAKIEAVDSKGVKESKETEETEMETPEMDKEVMDHDSMELKNYMFFGNLKTIKRCIDKMMAMDPSAVDELLSNGHDWAADHVATSKDDIEEVCSFLCNELDKTE